MKLEEREHRRFSLKEIRFDFIKNCSNNWSKNASIGGTYDFF